MSALFNPVCDAVEAALPVSDGWPVLEALREDEPASADAFPFHALGSVLGNAARAIAQDVQAPDSLAGGSVLAAAG